MNKKTNEELLNLADKATAGDKKALEELILSIKDPVFNLSLRMLGTFADAEDAAQDILLKIITHLSSFKKESAFFTWVFRIAVNYLKDYKRHMFAKHPLTFEFYGSDIEKGPVGDLPDLSQNVEKEILAEELKMSCSNVMLQCLDEESRCIFILGTMFRLDSRVAGEILGITPEAYRQRLSRIRRKMAEFLSEYCGEFGNGKCRCKDRINYAILSHRLNPGCLDYTEAAVIPKETLHNVKDAMEAIDDLAGYFTFLKSYESSDGIRQFIEEFLKSTQMSTVGKA